MKKRFIGKLFLCGAMAMMLISCKTLTQKKPGHPAMKDINQVLQSAYANNQLREKQEQSNIPANVTNALLPSLSVSRPREIKAEPRFDVEVNNVPAKTFFIGLVKGTNENMVISPKITGEITLHLKNVTTKEALQAVHDNYGYQYEKTSYGYRIYPPELETRMFTVNYLDVVRRGQSDTQVSSGQVSQAATSSLSTTTSTTTASRAASSEVTPASSVQTTSESAFWKQLLATLKLLIGDKDGRQVVINQDSGIIIVRAYPQELQTVSKYLDSLQSDMTRQVIIDAKILEVNLDDEYQAGINWKILGLTQAFTGASGLVGDSTDLSALTNNIFTLDAHYHNNFTTLIKLLSTEGNVQTLSSPRIATLNNQKAVIKVGKDQFFITNATSTSTSSTATENTQDVELTPFFSGISLDVTPQISGQDEVIMHIHPIVSSVTQEPLTYTLSTGTGADAGQSTLPTALSTIRESDNVVRAKSGQIIVIAGLMENKTKEKIQGTPFLGKVPLIGPMFRRTAQISEKIELVILLCPIVIQNHTWRKQLHKAAVHMRKFNRGFHFGDAPHIFGNLAEKGLKNPPKKKGKPRPKRAKCTEKSKVCI